MATLITGTRQFDISFKDFLGLTSTAKTTLNIAMSPTDDYIQRDITFKRFDSPEEYDAALSDNYLLVIEELEQGVIDIYPKLDKLNYLSRHIVEIKSRLKLIIKDSERNLKHSSFSFKNVSEDLQYRGETLTQLDIQTYLQKMEFALSKCADHLTALKRNIELTPQDEIPVPAHLLPNSYDSSPENPLVFFEYLISRNGLSEIKQCFIPVIEQDQYFLSDNFDSYDEATETRCLTDYDHDYGGWIGVSTKFSEFLLARLKKESFKSQHLIDRRISKSDENAIRHFIMLIIDQLNYLTKVISRDMNIHKYENVLGTIRDLTDYIYEKYSRFLPTIVDDVVNRLTHSTLSSRPATTNPGVFRWIRGSSYTISLVLHRELNGVYIEKIDLSYFHSAFSGGSPDMAQKIKWIDRPKNNSRLRKTSLLYLFKNLCEKNFIHDEYESPLLLRKLEHVFVDSKGDKLENWPQSKINLHKSQTSQYKRDIDSIVSILEKEAPLAE